jgi:cytochrome c oxidase subunit 2
MRRGSILTLVGIGVIAGGLATAVALLLPWLPHPAAREATRIDLVFWFVIGICIFIFALVAAALLYIVVRFRAAPDDDSDGPPIHGHTGLEIAWTIVPTILVTAIGIFSAVVLARNDALGKNVLHVDVTAQQFAWVPEFGQKQDTVPGLTTTLHITPDRLGTFPVICTELCGLGHAAMRSTAIVMTPAAFAAWVKSQSKTSAKG